MKDYTAVVKRKDSDELKHWKYIKREKVNGKWRYYYDVGTTGNVVNGKKSPSIKSYSKLQDILGYDERDAYDVARVNYNRAMKNVDDYKDWSNVNDKYDGKVHRELIIKENSTGKTASEAYERYKKTPIGALDALDDKIDAARNKVADILVNLVNKTRPKKEQLHNVYQRKK